MAKYCGIVVLALFLLAKFTDAATNELSLREKATNTLITELGKLANYTIHNGATILESVIVDPILLNVQTDTMKAKVEELSGLIETIKSHTETSDDQLHNSLSDIQLFDNFKNVMERYIAPQENQNSEDALIKQSLLAHNLMSLKQHFFEVFPTIEKDLLTAIDEYLATNPDAGDKADLIDLQNDLKNTQGVKNLNIMLRFVLNLKAPRLL